MKNKTLFILILSVVLFSFSAAFAEDAARDKPNHRTAVYHVKKAAPAAANVEQAPAAAQASQQSSPDEINKLVASIKENNIIEEEVLANGIKIIFKKNTSSDIIVMRLVTKAGSVFESEAKNGISSLLFDLAKKGNAKMNAEQIARGIEQTGASIGSEVYKNEGTFTLLSTLKSFEKNFDIFSECILSPTFPKEEVEKEKQFLMAGLKMENDKMDAACAKLFYKTMFAGHPYALHHLGTLESVPNITRDDIVAWYKTIFVPENMTFVVVGNTDMKFVRETLSKSFGGLKKSEKTSPIFEETAKKIAAGYPAITSPREAREVKDKAQCFIYMGFLTEGVESKDYGSLKMLATVLGSGMSSRLFSILRDKESLAYQVTAYYQTIRGNSALIMLMGTQKEKYDQAVRGFKREIDRFRTELITEEEYARAKNKLVGSYALQRNTMMDQVKFLATWESLGLGAKFENQYLESVLAPTREDIQKAAQKYFDPNKCVMAVMYPSDKMDKTPAKPGAKPASKKEGKK